MPISVNSNPQSLSAQFHLNRSQRGLQTSLGRLASGLRITRASDDSAGLAISESLRSQIRGLKQARRNAMDGVSMTQTGEGALNETHSLLMRMRELAVQSSNGTLGSSQRTMINNEFTALRSEIDRIADVTEFNGISLLNGSTSTLSLQVGIHSGTAHRIAISLSSGRVSSLSTGLASASLTTQSGARSSLSAIDTAIDEVSALRGRFGVVQNRLLNTIDRLATAEENLSSAESRIRDADIAEETSNMMRGQILMQAGVSVLAQANQLPGMALSLLG